MTTYDITAKGTKVTVETATLISSVNNKPITRFKIDSTHVILFWTMINYPEYYICSQVFSINSSTKQLTAIGSVNTINYNGGTDTICCEQVDSTHYLIFYSGTDDDGYNAIIGVDGSYNTSTTTTSEWSNGTTIQDIVMQPVDSTHFAVWASNGESTGVLGRVFSVNTSTWAVTSIATGNRSFTKRTGTLTSGKIDSNHFVVFFSNWDGGVCRENYGFVIEINLSTYAMSNGSNLQIAVSGQNGLFNYCSVVDTTHVILFWYGLDIDSNQAGARVFTVDTSAKTLTPSGSSLSTRKSYNGCAKIDATHFINFYNQKTLVYVVNTSDWSISTVGSEVTFDASQARGNNPLEIDTGFFLNVWYGTSDYLYAQVFEVSLSTNISVSASVLSTTLSIQTPTITAKRSVSISGTVLSGTLSLQTPTIRGKANVVSSVLSASFSIPAHSIIIANNALISASPLVALFSIQTPTITTQREVTVSPSVITATFSLPTPTIHESIPVSVNANILNVSLSIPSITITTQIFALVSPSPLSASFTIPAYTEIITANIDIDASVFSASFSIPAYSVKIGTRQRPNALSSIISSNAVTIFAQRFVSITPTIQSLIFSIPTLGIIADFWQPKYPVDNVQIFSDKSYNDDNTWSDKLSVGSDVWSDKY